MNEFYIVCALPYSLAADAPFHVSLFFSPTIRTASPTTLATSTLFLDWAGTVRSGMDVQLFDQLGDIACEALLNPVDARLWRALFPPSTLVASSAVPRWEQRKWRSFAARQVHDIARNLHMATIYADPTSKPQPDQHPLADAASRLFGRFKRDQQAGAMPVPDEAQLTARLDSVIESAESLATIERLVAGSSDWLERITLELHRCRRYYERPESQDTYRPRPDPKAKVPDVQRAESEFHERCAMAGDHGELLRRLGLVIDLRVTDPTRLRQSQWLSAKVALSGHANGCRSPRVHCHAANDTLVSAPSGTDWVDGALRLGDETRFSVLTLDTDGSALKTERFLWTLPRLLRSADNDDPVDAATPALRSPGFTIAATQQALAIQQRLTRQMQLDAGFDGSGTAELYTEDLTRGFRVEVWDDHTRRWASLHHRLSSARVTGFGQVYADLPEEGFSQGTAAHETPGVDNSPVHVHDALFGWEGWSLSAPRPGKLVVHVDGEEQLQDAPKAGNADLVHPIRIETAVMSGTLPRLRYGRSYAFRAWAVDLAGNSRAHGMGDVPLAPIDRIHVLLSAQPPATTDATAWSTTALRDATREVLQRRLTPTASPEAVSAEPDVLSAALLHDPVVGDAVAARLQRLRNTRTTAAAALAQVQRRELVNAAMAKAVADDTQPFVRAVATRAATDVAGLMSAHAGSTGKAKGNAAIAAAVAQARDTVTPLCPFLRWEPVVSPALVPRKRYTEGESLRLLVVRSGVTQDPVTLKLTFTSPADYAAAANAALTDAGYQAVNERHLAPPKGSQMLAELHGLFDQAIGSTDAARQQKMLGWALCENGTFRDTTRADIRHPPNRLPQPGIALVHLGTPTEALVKDLDNLKPGDPLAPGQTVVHDVDNLALPYLPDPLARGISLVFPEAAQDRTIAFPFGTEGFTAKYRGTWPEIQPFRLVLKGGKELDGRVAGRVVTLTLPPGDTQLFRLASSLDRGDLELMGPWRSLPDDVRANADVAQAAADGWLWGLTPYEDVRLVHAVDRPLQVPRPIRLSPYRTEGATHAHLLGAVELHGPSTGSLAAEASWVDDIDDLSRDAPHTSASAAIAFRSQIRPYEDLAVLGSIDIELPLPPSGKVAVHDARHELNDTRHRMVDYRFRATTRFREYFAPALLKPTASGTATSLDDGQSVIAETVQVSIPSSARPAAPIVHSVIPLFRWSDATEPEQPLSHRHVRRAGVRIYLERPWFSSGNEELLGVLLAPNGNDAIGAPNEDGTGFPNVSKWGADPLWRAASVQNRTLSALQLESLLRAAGVDDRWAAARPVTAPATLPLAALPNQPAVTVLGYKPHYNATRQLWYVDVALDPGDAFWPFLRLAVCRYQPDSIAGCHLSAPIRCDFVQLPPERTASVSRTDEQHVRVVVAGPFGYRAGLMHNRDPRAALAQVVDQHRSLVARLQRRDPAIASDLGWETIATTRLVLRGHGVTDRQAAWVGELGAGEPIELTRPGDGPGDWRVMVEEWERLETDPDPARPAASPLPWEQRLIYADSFEL